MKKIFLVIYMLGLVLICSFRAPFEYYRYYDRSVVLYTHIFSNRGKILMGQLVLYVLIWSAFICLTYLLFVFLKKNMRPGN